MSQSNVEAALIEYIAELTRQEQEDLFYSPSLDKLPLNLTIKHLTNKEAKESYTCMKIWDRVNDTHADYTGLSGCDEVRLAFDPDHRWHSEGCGVWMTNAMETLISMGYLDSRDIDGATIMKLAVEADLNCGGPICRVPSLREQERDGFPTYRDFDWNYPLFKVENSRHIDANRNKIK